MDAVDDKKVNMPEELPTEFVKNEAASFKEIMAEESWNKEVATTFVLADGVSAFLLEDKSSGQHQLWLRATNEVHIPGCDNRAAKPLLMYAGGSWLSDTAKAPTIRQSKIPQLRLVVQSLSASL